MKKKVKQMKKQRGSEERLKEVKEVKKNGKELI